MPDIQPQYNLRRVLKPFSTFATVFQGQSVAGIGIFLTPDGVFHDPLAGRPGYAPNLVAGLPVPLGARIVLWLPKVFWIDESVPQTPVFYAYQYAVSWRLRSHADHSQQSKIPFHIPRQIAGVAETVITPGDRFVIPAGENAVVYNSADPASIAAAADQDLRAELLRVSGVSVKPSIAPDGTIAVEQQGVLPASSTFPSRHYPAWSVHELAAEGDELVLQVGRGFVTGTENWDFTANTGADRLFSDFFGSGLGASYPDLGAYAIVGVST